MKICCDIFEHGVIWGLIRREKNPNRTGWFLGEYDESYRRPKFDEPFLELNFCPFCGEKLKEK